ncbi:transcriptional regulator [Salmonella enterica]|uniref:Transcriptional regulator n=1 Tax=Salmonella enterica TaxID=28901 RepID=A0A403T689_SALER|nr:transcriptional regulator [Salmonella enterica]ECJ2364306.1 transcriptional regulator [Salmonella enterica subsp. diarizonae]EDL3493950.1 transcriptional regulator [Salmonella enterica subsp. enterica serovar Newport]ECJ2414668.1 transcriptional regulator [Salmonella enterica subsp. diarizonae]EGW7922153.1 transcriptional regulator [Salmonella enterica]
MITSFNDGEEPVRVIVHGDQWPVVSATEHMVKALLPESECETTFGLTTLLQRLSCYPDALILLCLRPREHIFLFYALKDELLCHPALVISDELLFSDRVVLHSWGGIQAVLHHELTRVMSRIQQGENRDLVKDRLSDFLSDPVPAMGYFAVPLTFNHPKRLMNYMSLLVHRATISCGLTPAQQKLLQEIHNGQHSLADMTDILDSCKKKIWQDKNQLLRKLGMRNRQYELLYGTWFREDIQRTEFMRPGDVQIARASHILRGVS